MSSQRSRFCVCSNSRDNVFHSRNPGKQLLKTLKRKETLIGFSTEILEGPLRKVLLPGATGGIPEEIPREIP